MIFLIVLDEFDQSGKLLKCSTAKSHTVMQKARHEVLYLPTTMHSQEVVLYELMYEVIKWVSFMR
jgi:hypothetical protein